MSENATTPVAPSEAGIIASEVASSFGGLVRMYEQHYSLSREEALRRAAEEPPAEYIQHLLDGPPDQVCWSGLDAIARTDPDRALARWEEVKRAALDELRTGHRAARAVEALADGAWERARFLALREELAAEWRPRNGVERQLIDTMAQAQAGYLQWLNTLTVRTNLESWTNDKRYRAEGRWGPPRQSDADAVEQAAAMVDRFNRIFLRTLRALCDMRRQARKVVVRGNGPVNVAEQQVNVNAAPPAASE